MSVNLSKNNLAIENCTIVYSHLHKADESYGDYYMILKVNDETADEIIRLTQPKILEAVASLPEQLKMRAAKSIRPIVYQDDSGQWTIKVMTKRNLFDSEAVVNTSGNVVKFLNKGDEVSVGIKLFPSYNHQFKKASLCQKLELVVRTKEATNTFQKNTYIKEEDSKSSLMRMLGVSSSKSEVNEYEELEEYKATAQPKVFTSNNYGDKVIDCGKGSEENIKKMMDTIDDGDF